ncbi:MAG: S-layer homology domain-containing protein [Acidimicrobiia bacterium]|nr:S-layer homology domain-containing protein [Acidimicrobiia bacterium]
MRTRFSLPGLLTRRRLLWIAVLAIGIVAASQVQVRAVPPPPVPWSAALSFVLLDGPTWESDRLPAEITTAGLSWMGDAPEAAWVRGSVDGTTWSDWMSIDLAEDHQPDPGTSEAIHQRPASGPVYLGRVSFVQYRVVDDDPGRLHAEGVETAGRGMSLFGRAQLFWRSLSFGTADTAEAVADQPTIIPRSAWGADSCLPDHPEAPEYGNHLEVMFVHHTYHAGSASNSYTEASVKDLIYSICSYHVNARGWKDIGYNFLIDKFGNIYEGRAGGIDEVVWAAHTEGFNYYSTGVAFIGDHSTVAPTAAAQAAFKELAAWKLDLHHVDPIGNVLIESLGGPVYAEGEIANLTRISGHRDAAMTSCPGWAGYSLLGGLRSAIDQYGGAKIYGGWILNDPVPGFPETGYDPVAFNLRFTRATAWTLEIADAGGVVVYSTSGTGTTAQVEWNTTVGGEAAPTGRYSVSVVGTVEGETDPWPVLDSLQLGDFVLPFSDDEDLVHEENIIAIAGAGITMGCADHLYCPAAKVTRGQMASFLARALDLPLSSFDHFADDDNSGHEGAINALADAGITMGCRAGLFCPDNEVTRGQMASFLSRSLPGLAPAAQDYFDDDGSHPAESDINVIAEAGITRGCGERAFCPWSPVTRAQMASFLARAFLGAGS